MTILSGLAEVFAMLRAANAYAHAYCRSDYELRRRGQSRDRLTRRFLSDF